MGGLLGRSHLGRGRTGASWRHFNLSSSLTRLTPRRPNRFRPVTAATRRKLGRRFDWRGHMTMLTLGSHALLSVDGSEIYLPSSPSPTCLVFLPWSSSPSAPSTASPALLLATATPSTPSVGKPLALLSSSPSSHPPIPTFLCLLFTRHAPLPQLGIRLFQTIKT